MGFDGVAQDEVGAGVDGFGVDEQLAGRGECAGAAGAESGLSEMWSLPFAMWRSPAQVSASWMRLRASSWRVRSGGDGPGQIGFGVAGRDAAGVGNQLGLGVEQAGSGAMSASGRRAGVGLPDFGHREIRLHGSVAVCSRWYGER